MTPKRSAPGRPRPPTDSKGSGTRDAGKRHHRAKSAASFVPLTSLTEGTPDPTAAFDRIRTIYFSTTKRTIHADLAHAIELLKSLPSEEAREKTTVYMEGLAQMRREWARKDRA
jgi:benzoyl-CoA reductase/2-hydroxyglutaryl-CoA dehydratase subunit BcrC/BadD/HgdB